MIFDTILALRRDNDYNYAKIQNTFIPYNGEVCLVDTARNGLRAKIGDGETVWAELSYTDEITASNYIIRGYLHDSVFYYDSVYQEKITPSVNKIYIDVTGNRVYFHNGNEYVAIDRDLPVASSTSAGVVKIYGEVGQNTDGTMTQKAITDELNTKLEASFDHEEELLILTTF